MQNCVTHVLFSQAIFIHLIERVSGELILVSSDGTPDSFDTHKPDLGF